VPALDGVGPPQIYLELAGDALAWWLFRTKTHLLLNYLLLLSAYV
jgi:hypothetical protein